MMMTMVILFLWDHYGVTASQHKAHSAHWLIHVVKFSWWVRPFCRKQRNMSMNICSLITIWSVVWFVIFVVCDCIYHSLNVSCFPAEFRCQETCVSHKTLNGLFAVSTQQQSSEMSVKPDEMVSYVINKKQRFVLMIHFSLATNNNELLMSRFILNEPWHIASCNKSLYSVLVLACMLDLEILFSERVIHIWNNLPENVDFSTVMSKFIWISKMFSLE